MAAVKKVVLKRYNGTDYEEVMPKTTTGQVIGLSEALGLKIDAEDIGSADGVASLNSQGKIPVSELPEDVLSGMSFMGTINSTDTQFPQTVQPGYDNENAGKFFIATGEDPIELELYHSAEGVEKFKGSDGVLLENGETVTVQPGDWVIIIEQLQDDPPTWSLVNNNQANRFLSKSGGKMSGNINMDNNDITSVGDISPRQVIISGDDVGISFEGGILQTPNTGLLKFTYSDEGTDTAHEIYHSGMDGDGSGVDADKLDGQHGNYYTNASNLDEGTINDARLPSSISSDTTGNASTASAWKTKRDFTFEGDVTGTVKDVDGSSDVSISLSVDDDSHTHTDDTVSTSVGVGYDDYFQSPTSQASIKTRFSEVAGALSKKNRTHLEATTPTSGDFNAIEIGDLWFDTTNESTTET